MRVISHKLCVSAPEARVCVYAVLGGFLVPDAQRHCVARSNSLKSDIWRASGWLAGSRSHLRSALPKHTDANRHTHTHRNVHVSWNVPRNATTARTHIIYVCCLRASTALYIAMHCTLHTCSMCSAVIAARFPQNTRACPGTAREQLQHIARISGAPHAPARDNRVTPVRTAPQLCYGNSYTTHGIFVILFFVCVNAASVYVCLCLLRVVLLVTSTRPTNMLPVATTQLYTKMHTRIRLHNAVRAHIILCDLWVLVRC